MNKIKLLSFVYVGAMLIASFTFAQKKPDIKSILKKVDADSARLVSIFEDIHSNPELGFMEVRTSGIVKKELEQLGYKVISGIAKTGVVGILENGSGSVIMYRADMDANAVKETTGLPYASAKVVKKEDGSDVPVMHACGHDAHVTWLIGVAKIMAENKNLWKGTLVLVAQPAEELILGAEAMVKDGLYDKGVPKPDILYILHTGPFPTGSMLNPVGPQQAGCDQIDVEFKGIGGHGSSPHLAKDPVIMAAYAIAMYQSIISRGINPLNAAVLTVGSVQAGIDNNVIPGSALLKLNLRWYDEKDRKIMVDGIKRINESIAKSYALPESLYPTITSKGWSYPLINDAEASKIFNRGHAKVIPTANIVTEFPQNMGSEDGHHLVIHNDKKTVYYSWVGTARPDLVAKAQTEGKLQPFSNHNSNYEVDLAAIPLGVKLAVSGLIEFFNSKK